MSVDVMIVGAAKSGTSTLLAYAGRHPRLLASRQPEMTWFTDPALYGQPFPRERYFGDEPGDGRLLVGKAAGLMYDADALTRLRDLSPAVRVVAILRDPVERAHSAFWHVRRTGRESLERFEDAIDGVDRGDRWAAFRYRYLEGSRYDRYVEMLFDCLGRNVTEVVIFEEFLTDPRRVVRPLADALGIDPEGFGADVPVENSARTARSTALAGGGRGVARAVRRVIPAGARTSLRRLYRRTNERDWQPPPLDPATEHRLRNEFAASVTHLEQLLGRSIDAWPRA